jgi:hypothetical protein
MICSSDPIFKGSKQKSHYRCTTKHVKIKCGKFSMQQAREIIEQNGGAFVIVIFKFGRVLFYVLKTYTKRLEGG